MKKILKTLLIIGAFVLLELVFFGCEPQDTQALEKLDMPEEVDIAQINEKFYITVSLVENADRYSVYIMDSTKERQVKRYLLNEEQALAGYLLVLNPGEYYITCTAMSIEEAYAESDRTDFKYIKIEKKADDTPPAVITHSITYILNGGSFTSDVPNSYNEGDYLALPTPVNGNKTFLGWYLDGAFLKEITEISVSMKVDLTIYAKWEGDEINTEYTGYYKNASNLFGNQLKGALRSIISSGFITRTYDNLKTDIPKTDADPKNPNNVILVFSKMSVKGKWDGGSTWNREHVWPQSLSWFKTSGAGSDLHHIRPVDPTVNSTYHNNRKYGMVSNGTAGVLAGKVVCHYNANYFEPLDDVKGDIARIIFYLLVRYQEADNYAVTRVAESMSMLLNWNSLDPVDDFEITRNEKTYDIQGNRNPFIDHPEFAWMIWN